MTGSAQRLAPALFDGERLTLARLFRGLRRVDLAHAIGVSPAAVTHYEQGRTRPKEAVLAAIALNLGFPPAFFEKGRSIHRVSEANVHFRSLRSTTKVDRDRVLARLSLIGEVVAEVEEHVTLPKVVIPSLPSPVEAADFAAELTAAEVRRRWGLGTGPIQHMARLLELKGAIVVRPTVATMAIDAFSTILQQGRPIVVLADDKDDAARSRMDAAHELGHVVMHEDAEPGRHSTESEARRFAAAFLLPAEPMLAELPRQVRWETYFDLKRRWGVSVAALLYRARTLGVLSPHAYQRAQARLSAQGWREREPVDLGAPPEEPRVLGRALGLIAARHGLTQADFALRLRLYETDLAGLLETAVSDSAPGPQLQVL